jgi:hypothetical protein
MDPQGERRSTDRHSRGRFGHHHLFALSTLFAFRERYLLGAIPRSADDPLVQLHSHLVLRIGQPSEETRFAGVSHDRPPFILIEPPLSAPGPARAWFLNLSN